MKKKMNALLFILIAALIAAAVVQAFKWGYDKGYHEGYEDGDYEGYTCGLKDMARADMKLCEEIIKEKENDRQGN